MITSAIITFIIIGYAIEIITNRKLDIYKQNIEDELREIKTIIHCNCEEITCIKNIYCDLLKKQQN